MPKIAVLLSGCGHLDGAEIRESVLTLLYLDQQGADVSIFAPVQPQHHVLNHITMAEDNATRDVLAESARIARGKIQPLSKLSAAEFDALIMPGGFGVAKNLSDFAFKGAKCTVQPEVQKVIESFHCQQKPIGAICIAPAVVAAALPNKGLTLTIGDNRSTAMAIEALGHTHAACDSDAVVTDEANRVVSCSAYMREDDTLARIATGIEKLVQEVLRLCGNRT